MIFRTGRTWLAPRGRAEYSSKYAFFIEVHNIDLGASMRLQEPLPHNVQRLTNVDCCYCEGATPIALADRATRHQLRNLL